MIISLKKLRDELRWASRFIEKKTTIPILSEALLSAGGGTLTITGTDLETFGVGWITGLEEEEWSLTIPVRLVLKYLDSMNGSVAEVEIMPQEENRFLIRTSDGGQAKFSGMSRESYPEIPTVHTSVTISNLGWAAPRAVVSISQEEDRFTLNGALLEVTETGSRMVSTDGHRLTVLDLKVYTKEDSDPVRVIVPHFALSQAGDMAGDGICLFGRTDGFVLFAISGRMIIARELTGKFPDYERVIPKGEMSEVDVNVAWWTRALKRVVVFADDRSLGVSLTIGSDLTMYAQSDGAAGEQHLPISYEGEEYRTGFNGSYLQDFLSLSPADGVCFRFNSKQAGDAAELQCPGHRYLIMPMRI